MPKRGLFLLLLLFLPIVSAIDYYADVNIEVDDSGFVTIEGSTNHPDLLVEDTAIYTSKKQSYWLLNITKEDTFSDFVYSVDLPPTASINYVKSSGLFKIENVRGKLTINGFGENKPFSIVIQYQTAKLPQYNIVILIIIAIILAIIFFAAGKTMKKGIKKQAKEKKIKKQKPKYNLSGLTARQKKIMKLLIEKNKPLTQAQIQAEIKIPKASVSRNVRSLELKGLIEKEKAGMTNLIKLKK